MKADPGIRTLLGLDPEHYTPHQLHGAGRSFGESNCYADVIVELLHACQLEPLAVMGCVWRGDFEGDQWSFYKPQAEEIEALYGIDIHEMQPYRPLAVQIDEKIAEGNTVVVELDSWYLPDTAGRSYRGEHVKTSVIPESIDLAGERMRYFHGPGYYELGGEDFRGALRTAGDLPDAILPPYVELVRFGASPPLSGGELRAAAIEWLRAHFARRPRGNPFQELGRHLEDEMERLVESGPRSCHEYIFATARMAGSAFEIAASQTSWLFAERATPCIGALQRIVEHSKLLSFKLSRLKPFDSGSVIDELARAYTEACDRLGALLDA
ncbi:MAG: DUF1839 family protein [Solirubrobacteraceae bacterium]